MTLLPLDCLRGRTVSVSASESPDLQRLGLMEGHYRLALAEIARIALTLGGGLQYCGHLHPDGYTTFLVREVQRYGRRDHPFSILLPWSVHRRLSLADIERTRDDLGLVGDVKCLSEKGDDVDCAEGRGLDPPGFDGEASIDLTSMRKRAVSETDARVVIGGKRSGYQGAMPGVLEEVLLAVESKTPLYLAGGFGGVTLDAIRAISPRSAEWFPAPSSLDSTLSGALSTLQSLADDQGWSILANGLSSEENAILAATHRPSEIATLTALGISRLHASTT